VVCFLGDVSECLHQSGARFCLHSLQKKHARRIAEKVRSTEKASRTDLKVGARDELRAVPAADGETLNAGRARQRFAMAGRWHERGDDDFGARVTAQGVHGGYSLRMRIRLAHLCRLAGKFNLSSGTPAICSFPRPPLDLRNKPPRGFNPRGGYQLARVLVRVIQVFASRALAGWELVAGLLPPHFDRRCRLWRLSRAACHAP
jgi:hypothetical protein